MLLNAEVRPTVLFRPESAEHRRYFAQFRQRGGWGQCPVRFTVTDWPNNNLVAAIQSQLIDYYLQAEFAGSESATELHGCQV